MAVDFRLEKADQARRLLAHLPGGVHRAMRAAVKRAISAARTTISKELREQYRIPAGTVRPAFSVRRASFPAISAQVDVKGRRLPLGAFAHNPKSSGHQGPNKPPLTVQVKKGEKRKPVKGAFVARKKVIARRADKDRMPLEFFYGPAVPQMAQNPEVLKMATERAQEILDKRFQHEVDWLLKSAAERKAIIAARRKKRAAK